jgi:predicted glycosyltransferase
MKKQMRLLIDILTPKQALFLGELAKKLMAKGHIVYVTTRKFNETLQMIERKNIHAEIIGEYGKSKYEKLTQSLDRALKISNLIYDRKIDLTISFSSVEAARASFGLSIPHMCVSDSPHAEAVSRLTMPLSKKLFTPKVIPKREWIRYGINSNNIIHYDALDPIAWIKNFKLNMDDLVSLKLDFSKKIITIRMEENFAAYLMNCSNDYSITVKVLRKLLEKNYDAQIVILPRYKEQHEILERNFKDEIIIPSKMIYAPSLLSCSDVFIGGGGTMTAEAALLGIPTISCFPGNTTCIDQFLSKRGMILRSRDPKKIIDWSSKAIFDKRLKERLKKKADYLKSKMEDPLKIILIELLRTSI